MNERNLDSAVCGVVAPIPVEWVDTGIETQGLTFDAEELFPQLRGEVARSVSGPGLTFILTPLIRNERE